jgi:aarF domain-containing kinase
VEQFSYTMAAQAHLNVEGHHLEVLNYNFRSWHHINFPRPIYASSCVIVETFEPGRIVTEVLDTYDAMAKQVILSEHGTLTVEEVDDIYNADKTEGIGSHFVPINVAKFIVTNGLALYLKMLLVDNLMHADLHVSTDPIIREGLVCALLLKTFQILLSYSLEISCWI